MVLVYTDKNDKLKRKVIKTIKDIESILKNPNNYPQWYELDSVKISNMQALEYIKNNLH